MSLQLFRPRVMQFVRDGAGVLADPGDYDLAIEEAVRRYSRIRPRTWVADIVGDGGFDYPLPNPGWDDEVSRILEVEYPAGRRERMLVDRLDWQLYRSPAGTELRLLRDTPTAEETIRLTFTGSHTIDETTTSVPNADHTVILYLGAALACEQLASHYTVSGAPSIQADTVDHGGKASEYASRAARFMKLANELLPIKEQGEVRAAGGETSLGDSMDLLSHRHR